jgi:hypothetical protein
MNRTLDAALLSWPVDPWLWFGLLLTAGVYLRGWLALRRRNHIPDAVSVGGRSHWQPSGGVLIDAGSVGYGGVGYGSGVGHVWHAGQLTAFCGGLVAIFLALGSSRA